MVYRCFLEDCGYPIFFAVQNTDLVRTASRLDQGGRQRQGSGRERRGPGAPGAGRAAGGAEGAENGEAMWRCCVYNGFIGGLLWFTMV